MDRRGRRCGAIRHGSGLVPINFSDLLYGPVYQTLGVPIDFALADDRLVSITGLDKTAGVEVTAGDLEVQTVRPAAVIRMADLIEQDVAPNDLMNAICQINGTSWKVRSYFPKPSPSGEADGELYLILIEAP